MLASPPNITSPAASQFVSSWAVVGSPSGLGWLSLPSGLSFVVVFSSCSLLVVSSELFVCASSLFGSSVGCCVSSWLGSCSSVWLLCDV